MIEAKDYRSFIRIYSLFKSERLNTNIKLTLHKALTRLVMTNVRYACELAADTYLLKLQPLKNKVFSAGGNLARCIPARDLHTAFKVAYIYNYITKLGRKQTEVVLNYENEPIYSIGQGEARHGIYKSWWWSSLRPFK
jgi:hypothetical protein